MKVSKLLSSGPADAGVPCDRKDRLCALVKPRVPSVMTAPDGVLEVLQDPLTLQWDVVPFDFSYRGDLVVTEKGVELHFFLTQSGYLVFGYMREQNLTK